VTGPDAGHSEAATSASERQMGPWTDLLGSTDSLIVTDCCPRRKFANSAKHRFSGLSCGKRSARRVLARPDPLGAAESESRRSRVQQWACPMSPVGSAPRGRESSVAEPCSAHSGSIRARESESRARSFGIGSSSRFFIAAQAGPFARRGCGKSSGVSGRGAAIKKSERQAGLPEVSFVLACSSWSHVLGSIN
jgi:hypothetical protein